MEHVVNRRLVFDAVRVMLGRGFRQDEVERLDRALDAALSPASTVPAAHRLGALSERFESGDRGPGAVSSGQGDPGGVSYGIWQLSSRAGTAAAFAASEGAPLELSPAASGGSGGGTRSKKPSKTRYGASARR